MHCTDAPRLPSTGPLKSSAKIAEAETSVFFCFCFDDCLGDSDKSELDFCFGTRPLLLCPTFPKRNPAISILALVTASFGTGQPRACLWLEHVICCLLGTSQGMVGHYLVMGVFHSLVYRLNEIDKPRLTICLDYSFCRLLAFAPCQ